MLSGFTETIKQLVIVSRVSLAKVALCRSRVTEQWKWEKVITLFTFQIEWKGIYIKYCMSSKK